MMKAFLAILLFVSACSAQISRDAIVRTVDEDGGSDTTTGTISGGTDKTFVLIAQIRGDDDISSGPVGGSLTWTEQVDACVDGGQHGLHIFTAQGTASSFTVSITLASVSASVITHVITYSGVETTSGFQDQHWENPNGEGTCDSSDPETCPCNASTATTSQTFTIGNTNQDSWFVIAVSSRNDLINSGDSGLSNKIVDVGAAGGGDESTLTSYDLDRSTSTGDVGYTFGFDGSTDPVVAGIVMKELSAAPASKLIVVD